MRRKPLLLQACLLAGVAVGGASCVAPAPSMGASSSQAMSQELEIVQGRTLRYGGQAVLGFVDVFEAGKASLDLWHEGEKLWLARLQVGRGDIFPVGGHFLRVAELLEADEGTRARLRLDEVADAGGLRAADATHPVLVEGGVLEVGLSRVAFAGEPAAGHAPVEVWPKVQKREKVAPADLERSELAVGGTLAFGNRRLQVVRIQPRAGEVLGYVEFEVLP